MSPSYSAVFRLSVTELNKRIPEVIKYFLKRIVAVLSFGVGLGWG